MKNIIRKLLRESLLDEAMMNSTHLPKETALFSQNNGIYMSLYDPITKNAYGMISASLRGQNYDVNSVAAEKGFGPYMYEFAMMNAYSKGKGLMPSRDGDVRERALDVWLRFYDRTDVKKQQIAPFDSNGNWNDEYSVAIYTGDEEGFDDPEEFQEFWNDLEPETQDIIKKFNTVYSMAPSEDYHNMLARSEAYIKKGMNPERAFKAAQNLFMEKYD
jgi:hypothetical protein